MHKQTGFTLIELIMVIALAGIIAVFTTMCNPGTGPFNLDSISEQVKRDIRYTQILAMGLNTSYTITISPGSYTISPTPPTGSATMTLPAGVTLTAATITFDSNGTPITGAASVTVTTNTGNRILTLYDRTGFVDG